MTGAAEEEYRFRLYETLDSGRIACMMLNRPDARNTQNRGLMAELDDAFLRAGANNEVRVLILGLTEPMFCSGHDIGSKTKLSEMLPGPNQHPSTSINGGHPQGRTH